MNKLTLLGIGLLATLYSCTKTEQIGVEHGYPVVLRTIKGDSMLIVPEKNHSNSAYFNSGTKTLGFDYSQKLVDEINQEDFYLNRYHPNAQIPNADSIFKVADERWTKYITAHKLKIEKVYK